MNVLKKGSMTIEACMLAFITFPVIASLIMCTFTYFNAASVNVNLNFEVGRIVSTTGCSQSKLSTTVNSSSKFENYDVYLVQGGRNIQLRSVQKSAGRISVECQANAIKGTEFKVSSSLDAIPNTFKRFFPLVHQQHGFYIQEVTS